MQIPLLTLACIAISITILALRKRSVIGSTSLIVFSVSLASWAVSILLERLSSFGIIWLSIASLSANVASAAVLTYNLEYGNLRQWLNKTNAGILIGLIGLSQILLWSNYSHAPYLNGVQRLTTETIADNSPSFLLSIGIINGLLLLSAPPLINSLIRIPRPYRLEPAIILVGVLAPVLIGFFDLARLIPLPYFFLMPFILTFTGLTLVYGFFRGAFLEIVPIGRDTVIERMKDGWMVLDKRNRIIDLNPAAEELIGISRDKIFGKPAENVLSNWPNLKPDQIIGEKEIKGSINLKGDWRYLHIRIFPLIDRGETQIGQVIVWRDITERRKGDDARQRAREEMFTLLHAISGTASRALNLDDFLSETIYQIVYSFQSQSSVVYLLEENNNEPENPKLFLAAHHGIPAWSVDSMASVSVTNEMIAWTLKQREPLLIPDISTDPRVPAPMQQAGHISFLMVPMSIEGQIIGAIGLARTEGPVYSSDEIARLTVVADEVAIFIHSDRQRQSAIAMAERQRLVRDLHDSVTQKLYGLLTLTEAAQAGLEAGSMDMPAQVLSRIGEHARQALKEMRLFLFELQPVDLEREGLVSVLHQRLAAVEGRADIKARLLADDNISLPLNQEIALYFIAQEALNNVLKHANAGSVTVRLKKRKSNILLDIEDDGCGFDTQKTDQTGMGLRNIKERVSQAGGKLKIASAPGKGTKVSVTINRTKSTKNHKQQVKL